MLLKISGIKENFTFPDEWQQLNTMPEDPIEACVLGKETENSHCMALIYPINENNIMAFDNPKIVIDSIHNSLADDQGLIEVISSKNNLPFIYSIVKTLQKPSGIQYFLKLHFKFNNKYYCIDAFFIEIGTTGIRDFTVYELKIRDGIIKTKGGNGKTIIEGWCSDPYDENYKKGILMNLSEYKTFDKMFPLHPLSEARDFVNILNSNFKKINNGVRHTSSSAIGF